MSVTQLNPTLPLDTPKGPALAHFLIDYGEEHNLIWVAIQNETGEIWAWPNPQVRGQKNITFGRADVGLLGGANAVQDNR